MAIEKQETLVELGSKKNWIKNPFIRKCIDLQLISKEEYLSLKWKVEDQRIINWLWARAIKLWIKDKFDKIMTSWVDKWDKL